MQFPWPLSLDRSEIASSEKDRFSQLLNMQEIDSIRGQGMGFGFQMRWRTGSIARHPAWELNMHLNRVVLW